MKRGAATALEEYRMQTRRKILTALATGLGAAVCLPRSAPAAGRPASAPAACGPPTGPSGKPAASLETRRDLGALVKKNYSGRG